jgi:hypothetical protein
MHRFLLHDAEHASRELFGGSFDLLGSREDRDRFEPTCTSASRWSTRMARSLR